MAHFAQSRKNMVDCQLAPNGITDDKLMSLFADIPREFFLPEDKKSYAYVDEDILLNEQEFLLEPVVHARLMQYADFKETDVLLNIGDSTGYVSAIAANLVATVVTLEKQTGQLDRAREIWAEHSTCNVATITGQYPDGSAENAPYDVILINGAVGAVPESLLDQLALGGRLVCVKRPNALESGRIQIISRISEDQFSTLDKNDSSTPYVDGFEPQEEFVL